MKNVDKLDVGAAQRDVLETALAYDSALKHAERLAAQAAEARRDARLALTIHRAACATLRTAVAVENTKRRR